MSKPRRSYIVMFLLLSQTLLAVLFGMFALYLSSKEHVMPNVYIESLYVGNHTESQAIAMMTEYFDKLSPNASLLIKYDSDKKYSIKFADIDVSIDYKATVDAAYSFNGSGTFAKIINGFFSSDKKIVYPAVGFDEIKLEKKLKELKLLIDTPPVNAKMHMENGVIKKVPEVSGLTLNILNAIDKIKGELGRHLDSPIEFNAENNYEISKVQPKVTLEDLKTADSIISSYTTKINSPELKESIKNASRALNGCFLHSRSDYNKGEMKELSFNQRLNEKNLSMEIKNDGYSQVASTLYAALLKTGIELEYIERTRNETPVDYIEPGLDVKIFGDNSDFKFKNPFDFPIAIFSQYNEESVTVYIVGNKKTDYCENKINVNVVQRFEPPVLRVVNYDLKPSEEKVISAGKQGVEVEVYRVVNRDGKDNPQLIYTNKYNAVGAIMQVGPESMPDRGTIK